MTVKTTKEFAINARRMTDARLSAEQLDDKYNPEGGGQHPEACLSRAAWRFEVAQQDTISGYWDWLYSQLQRWHVEQRLGVTNAQRAAETCTHNNPIETTTGKEQAAPKLRQLN